MNEVHAGSKTHKRKQEKQHFNPSTQKKEKTTEAGHGVRTQTGLVNGCDNKNHTMVKLQMHTGYGAKYYFIKDLGWYLVLIFVQIFNFIEFFQIAIDGQNLYPSLT